MVPLFSPKQTHLISKSAKKNTFHTIDPPTLLPSLPPYLLLELITPSPSLFHTSPLFLPPSSLPLPSSTPPPTFSIPSHPSIPPAPRPLPESPSSSSHLPQSHMTSTMTRHDLTGRRRREQAGQNTTSINRGNSKQQDQHRSNLSSPGSGQVSAVAPWRPVMISCPARHNIAQQNQPKAQTQRQNSIAPPPHHIIPHTRSQQRT